MTPSVQLVRMRWSGAAEKARHLSESFTGVRDTNVYGMTAVLDDLSGLDSGREYVRQVSCLVSKRADCDHHNRGGITPAKPPTWTVALSATPGHKCSYPPLISLG